MESPPDRTLPKCFRIPGAACSPWQAAGVSSRVCPAPLALTSVLLPPTPRKVGGAPWECQASCFGQSCCGHFTPGFQQGDSPGHRQGLVSLCSGHLLLGRVFTGSCCCCSCFKHGPGLASTLRSVYEGSSLWPVFEGLCPLTWTVNEDVLAPLQNCKQHPLLAQRHISRASLPWSAASPLLSILAP